MFNRHARKSTPIEIWKKKFLEKLQKCLRFDRVEVPAPYGDVTITKIVFKIEKNRKYVLLWRFF